MTTTAPEPTRTTTPGLVDALAAHGDAVALLTTRGSTSYAELAGRVDDVRRRLGTARRLVLVEGRSTPAALAGYLGALAADCPVLLVPPGGAHTAAARAYDPDVVVRSSDDAVQVVERRDLSAHDLHPDLALLLSTSGSSGSPKLVRLSRRNLLSNAAAIADALDVRPDDRAITTLPLHYCYGLSVVHSHLLRGAGLVLTEDSVLDASFWDLFRATGTTTLPAVPYTFELLDRVGFADLALPSLRRITQAGGRLAPERVRAHARLGAQGGWDLLVMYGQTEATARMSVLPAPLALTRPESIGLPVPGGSFALEPVEGQPDGVGELVYSGANVMLGYATSPADLALGRTVHRLRTGDLARRGADGLYEVVGRRSRFVKLFGLRLDQAHLEQQLAADGLTAAVEPAGEDRLGVVVEAPAAVPDVVRRVAGMTGLPRHAVVVRVADALPRTAAGKTDATAVRTLLAAPPAAEPGTVAGLFEELLGGPVHPGDTFVGLGGDSLSYVEMSVRLEELLGPLPADWPTRRVDALTPSPPTARRAAGLDTTVALRAVAIVLVVGSHSKLFDVLGGAHLLLLLAGYNLGRFQLARPGPGRSRALLTSVRRIALPAVVWAGGVVLLSGPYGWQNVLLLNAVLGPDEWGREWSLWFLEALVALLLLVAALVAVPGLSRWQSRHPFAAPMALVAAGLLVRFDLTALPTGPGGRSTAPALLWLFALGWAAAAARRRREQVLVAAVAAVALLGWFGDPQRELVVLGGLVLLLAAPRLPCPALLGRAAGLLAGASLYVYVTHWQVYPLWEHTVPALSLVASFAVGLAYWRLWEHLARRASALTP